MIDELERTVMGHGYQIKAVKDGLERQDASTMNLRKDLDELEKSHYAVRDMVKEMKTASEATQKYAKDISEKAITVKQFYVGVGALLIAIIALAASLAGFK